MTTRGLILPDVPLNLDDVQLGSLVPDPRQPHLDALVAKALKLGDITARTRRSVIARLDASRDASLSANLTRIFRGHVAAGASAQLKLEAAEGAVYELRKPRTWFATLCSLPKVRTWLEEGADDDQDAWLVIGLRTLSDARIRREDRVSHTAELQVSLPVSQAVANATPAGPAAAAVVGDSLDMGASGNIVSQAGMQEEGEMEGERIYAVGLRRVKYRWYKKSTVNAALLDSHTVWESVSDVRTASTKDGDVKVVEVQLMGDDKETPWASAALGDVELGIEEDGEDDYIYGSQV
jgi:hypothetical protein